MAKESLSVAFLNIRIQPGTVASLAPRLAELGVPFAFYMGWQRLRQMPPHFKFVGRAVGLSSGCNATRPAMSRKGDRLRDKAEELRTSAGNILAEECHRISLELAAVADELADQWDAIDLTIADYLGSQAAAK